VKHLMIATLAASAALAGCGSKKDEGNANAKAKDKAQAQETNTPAAPAIKAELTSASWNDQKAGPLAFDRQVFADDGHGNAQLYLLANCPKAPAGCAVLRYEQLKPEVVSSACPGWTMVHLAFNPKEGQKADMGPLTLVPGKLGGETAPVRASMVEYTNRDRSIGGQAYDKGEGVELTQVTDTTIAGSFDVKDGAYAYKGAFSATKCTCRESDGYCTEAGVTAAAPTVGEGKLASGKDLVMYDPPPVKGFPADSMWLSSGVTKDGEHFLEYRSGDTKFVQLQFIDCNLPVLKEYAAKPPGERGDYKYCFDAPTGELGGYPMWNYEDGRRVVEAGHLVLVLAKRSDGASLTDADLEAWLLTNDLAAIASM
jgi:hypothetical protein